MSADGWLENLDDPPYVEIRCYVCGKPILRAPRHEHAACVENDSLRYDRDCLRYDLEILSESEVVQ